MAKQKPVWNPGPGEVPERSNVESTLGPAAKEVANILSHEPSDRRKEAYFEEDPEDGLEILDDDDDRTTPLDKLFR